MKFKRVCYDDGEGGGVLVGSMMLLFGGKSEVQEVNAYWVVGGL